MKLSGGEKEDEIVVGNVFDKYGSNNPIVNWIMNGFNSSLSEFISRVDPSTIHEVGCGEGFWVLTWLQKGISTRGSDFSVKVIEIARQNAMSQNMDPSVFSIQSIYELEARQHSADLIVCCEVLEHLEEPEQALASLQRITKKNLILSVPREPLWRILNMARGKYISSWGNTPGHIQHWSSRKFVELVSQYFTIVAIKKPLPWTMLLCQPISKQNIE